METNTKILLIMICIILAVASLYLLRGFRALSRNSETLSEEEINKKMKIYLTIAACIFAALIVLTIFVFVAAS